MDYITMHTTFTQLVTWCVIDGGCRLIDLQMAIQYRTDVQIDLLRLGLVTSRSSYTGSVVKVISSRIRIESVVQVIFNV